MSAPRRLRLSGRDCLAVAPALALFLGLAAYEISLAPTWIGQDFDDAAYYLMSRNVWQYGAPLLDHAGPAEWSTSWSPVFSFLVSPLGALPMGAAVVAERITVMLAGAAFLAVTFFWLRRDVGLSRLRAGLATTCVASTYALVHAGALVMSDLPAALALIVGVVLLRREQLWGGFGALLLAALIRPMYLAALAGALVWLFVTQRHRKPVVKAVVAATGLLVVATGAAAAAGYRGYFSQVVHPASGGVPETIVAQVKALTWYPLNWIAYSPAWLVRHARIVLKLGSLCLLGVAAVGARRRGLGLEALFVAATAAALLLYRTNGANDARYVIPLTPLVVGGIAAALDRRGRGWTVGLAGITALAVASGVFYFVDVTPSRSAFSAEVAARRHAYEWVRRHVSRADEVVALNDVQAFLYSGHRVDDKIYRFIPGRTFLIWIPESASLLPEKAADLLEGYRRTEVFRERSIVVYRVDARAPQISSR